MMVASLPRTTFCSESGNSTNIEMLDCTNRNSNGGDTSPLVDNQSGLRTPSIGTDKSFGQQVGHPDCAAIASTMDWCGCLLWRGRLKGSSG